MSWKEKLANKSTSAVIPKESINVKPVTQSSMGGWKQKLSDKQSGSYDPATAPIVHKVDISNETEFPTLGGASAVPKPKKETPTGFATLAREWAVKDKEDKEREAIEEARRQQVEFAYNYNASRLNAINASLMNLNDQRNYYSTYNNDSDEEESDNDAY
jgi:hypothetical protein